MSRYAGKRHGFNHWRIWDKEENRWYGKKSNHYPTDRLFLLNSGRVEILSKDPNIIKINFDGHESRKHH